MPKTSKIVIGIIVIIIIIGGIWYGVSRKPVEEGAIKIGFIGPLTGDAAVIGQNAKSAIEIAVEEINSKGGINGRKLEVIFEDGKIDPKEAANVANKLVNINRVPVIIGGLASSETLAVAPIAETSKTVLISPCSSNPDITNAGDFIFRDFPSDTFQGKVAAEFAYNDLGVREIAIFYCLSDWCTGVSNIFEEVFTKLGGTIVAKEAHKQTDRDLRTQLTKIKNAEPELIYFTSYIEATIVGLRQAKELGMSVKMLGGDGWSDPKIPTEGKKSVEGIMWTENFAPLSEEFNAKMKEKTGGGEVTTCSPQAYDAVHIIAEIMKKVGTNSTAIKNELYKIKDYNGVSGKIGFDKNGDLLTANFVIKTIKDGQAVLYEE